jgi:pilus assembly protein CpaE
MAIYVCNVAPGTSAATRVESRIRTSVPDLIKIERIDDIVHGPASGADQPACVLVIAPGDDKAYLPGLIETASRYRGRIFFILVGDELSAADYKMLVRTRAADWVSATADPQEILDIVAQAGRAAPHAGGGGARPVAIAFVPSAGGVGNATLIVETAIALKTAKATKNLKICMIDLDFQNSHICDYLDIEPRLQIEEISADPGRLDAQLFDIFISRHASGLHVFAAPRTKFRVCDLNVMALDALFDMTAERYDLILIDLPVTWFSWTRQIIGAMDGTIVTGLNSVPGLRQIVETLGEVRHAAPATGQIAVAVNRCERGLFGRVARRRHVESVLPDETLLFIGDQPTALQSINTGQPMVLGPASRSVNKDIAAIGAFCVGLRTVRTARE